MNEYMWEKQYRSIIQHLSKDNIKNTNINPYIFVCVCEHLIIEPCNCCCNKLQTLFYMWVFSSLVKIILITINIFVQFIAYLQRKTLENFRMKRELSLSLPSL